MIVTFYSYKGGVGRSMAVANTAWILASNGMRVLAIDWDLTAPGLHRYFHPFLDDTELTSSPGVIDMVRDYAEAVVSRSTSPDPRWVAQHADPLRYAVSLRWQFPDSGCLDLLPPGRQHAGYSAAVNTFDWDAFLDTVPGRSFFDQFATNLRATYDAVLIDASSGLGASAGICTLLLPDTIVALFTLSRQGIAGTASVARSILRRHPGPIRILPTAARVEDAEQVKLEAGRDYARLVFAGLTPTQDQEGEDRYWSDAEIPYRPFYAFEEILATFADRSHLEGSLLSAYERLAATVTGGRVSKAPLIDESRRREMLAAFERTRR